MVSPSGPRLAARFGASLLSISATTVEGFSALGSHWDVMEERAAALGTSVDRSRWRLVGPMHIASSMEQAREDVEFGLMHWLNYFTKVAALPLKIPELGIDDLSTIVDLFNASGIAVIGTPDMAIEAIRRLEKQSGGFGTYLFMAHEWGDRDATLKSYELFARHVAPAFQASTDSLLASRDRVAAGHAKAQDQVDAAIQGATDKYVAERDATKRG
jgi:limonene 1,2-monooxygenase